MRKKMSNERSATLATNIKKVGITAMVAMMCAFAMPATGNLPAPGTAVAEAASKPKLTKKKLSLTKGSTYKLRVKGSKSKVKWTSSKKSVANVSSSGVVKAKKKGSATITAKVKGKKLICKVTVKNGVRVYSGECSNSGLTLKASVDKNGYFSGVVINNTGIPISEGWVGDFRFAVKTTQGVYFAELDPISSMQRYQFHYNLINHGQRVQFEGHFGNMKGSPTAFVLHNLYVLDNGLPIRFDDGTQTFDFGTVLK